MCCCTPKRPAVEDVQRISRPMMGTLVEVVWRSAGQGAEAETVRSAMDRMEVLASRMSLYSPDSELAEINAEAGKAPVKVSDELLDVVEKSLRISRMTEGAFDATVGPVEAVWGDIQKEGGGKLPFARASKAPPRSPSDLAHLYRYWRSAAGSFFQRVGEKPSVLHSMHRREGNDRPGPRTRP